MHRLQCITQEVCIHSRGAHDTLQIINWPWVTDHDLRIGEDGRQAGTLLLLNLQRNCFDKCRLSNIIINLGNMHHGYELNLDTGVLRGH
jgi:hypothetical protein